MQERLPRGARARRAISNIVAAAFLVVAALVLGSILFYSVQGLIRVGGPLELTAVIAGGEQVGAEWVYSVVLNITSTEESVVVGSISLIAYDRAGNIYKVAHSATAGSGWNPACQVVADAPAAQNVLDPVYSLAPRPPVAIEAGGAAEIVVTLKLQSPLARVDVVVGATTATGDCVSASASAGA